MYNFTIPMALVDYIPVLFFGIAALILQRDLYNKMYKGAYALFAAGWGMMWLYCLTAPKKPGQSRLLRLSLLAALTLLSPMLYCAIRMANPQYVHRLMTYSTVGMYLLDFADRGSIIYFGVLHCLGVCMLLWPLFRKCPVWLLAALGVILGALVLLNV